MKSFLLLFTVLCSLNLPAEGQRAINANDICRNIAISNSSSRSAQLCSNVVASGTFDPYALPTCYQLSSSYSPEMALKCLQIIKNYTFDQNDASECFKLAAWDNSFNGALKCLQEARIPTTKN